MSQTVQPTSMRRVLRDRAYGILQQVAFFKDWKIEPGRALPVPDSDFPFLGIWAWVERGNTESPAGTAPMSLTTATLHFVAYYRAIDLGECEDALDCAIEQIRNGLLTNPDFFINASTGVADVRDVTSHQVQVKIDGSGDAHLGQASLSLDVTYNEIFEPVLLNDLETVGVTVEPNAAGPGAGATLEATTVLATS
jgi:hypothetical protein